jgi:glycosyltransferase involved in cell wall biosynthesis
MAFGVNFIADLHGDGSLSEIARSTLDAIRTQAVPFTYSEVLYPYQMYRTAEVKYPRFIGLPSGQPYPVNLLNYNLHIFETLSPERLAELTQGKYTIGNWVWEMPQIPEAWLPHFERIEEAWVPSSFTQGIFQRHSSLPTYVMHHPIEVPTSPQPQRAAFGLPQDRLIFLFTFSVGSGDGRKNPWGVMEAFERAFGRSTAPDGPLLVLKCQHSADYPNLMQALRGRMADLKGVLLDTSYPRPQFNDLLACADVYVSLHRAEGFGLGMAEAMYLGKPVIATAYSGNLDYMSAENSYLVDYHLRYVQPDDHRYRPELLDLYHVGLQWAEPNLDQAAAYMAQIAATPAEARQRGERAAQHIQAHFSLNAMGQKMAQRLREVVEKLAQS